MDIDPIMTIILALTVIVRIIGAYHTIQTWRITMTHLKQTPLARLVAPILTHTSMQDTMLRLGGTEITLKKLPKLNINTEGINGTEKIDRATTAVITKQRAKFPDEPYCHSKDNPENWDLRDKVMDSSQSTQS